MVPTVPTPHAKRILAVLATIVCLIFTSTLHDHSPYFITFQSLRAAPLANDNEPRDGSITTHINNTAEDPIHNARVIVLAIRDDIAYFAGSTTTNEQGIAVLNSLPRGVIWILADAKGHSRASTQLVLGPDHREATLKLGPAHSVSFEILSDDGSPINNATVTVSCSDPLPFAGQTNEAGLVTIDRLCPPPYSLVVAADGFETTIRENVAEQDATLRFSLRKLGWIEVSVIDQNGASPLSTVLIAGPTIWPTRKTLTDAFGKTKISALPAGTYDLRATNNQLASPIASGIPVERGKGTDVMLVLESGRMVTVTVVGGIADNAPPVEGASVVLVEGGLSSFPLQGETGPDGTVILGPVPPGQLSASARVRGYVGPSAVKVGADETSVRIELLKAGKLTGEVVDSRGFAVPGCSIEVIGTDTAGIPIAETPASIAFRSAHFAWALPGPPTLIPAGELVVMPGVIPPIPRAGSPMPGKHSSGSEQSDIAPWVTNSQGHFSAAPVPPGNISAIVRHPAYIETISSSVSIPPGGSAHVKVVLHSGGTLEGIVLDDRRFPISGAIVRASAQVGTSEKLAITSTDGSFAFTAIASTVIITASRPESPDKVAFQKSVAVPASERTQIEIILSRERPPVSIRVTDNRGYPLDGAKVRAVSLSNDIALRRTAFTNAKGNATIEDAAGIKVRLEVSASGFAPYVDSITASQEEITVILHPGLRIEGQLTTRDGRDRVANAKVTAFLTTGTQAQKTGADGMFRFDDISAGTLRLLVNHDEFLSVERSFEIDDPSDASKPVQLGRIDLESAGMIEGEVVDDRGNPVIGAIVSKDDIPDYLPVGPLPAGMVATDRKGNFLLGGLAEGEITLQAFAPGIGRGKEERIQVRKERTTRMVRIRLSPEQPKTAQATTSGVAITLVAPSSGSGALVTAVSSGSEAERAGVRTGDLIVEIDGITPDSERDAERRLQGPEHQSVVLRIQRGQSMIELRVPRERVRK